MMIPGLLGALVAGSIHLAADYGRAYPDPVPVAPYGRAYPPTPLPGVPPLDPPLTHPRITLFVTGPYGEPVPVMPDSRALVAYWRRSGFEAQVMLLPGGQVMMRFAPAHVLCAPLRSVQPRPGEVVYVARYPVVGQLVVTGAIVDGVELAPTALSEHFAAMLR